MQKLLKTAARRGWVLAGLAGLALAPARADGAATACGELKQWQCVTLTFQGPMSGEQAPTNPFKDARLDVVFSQGARKLRVPGYYAADGNAARSGAERGNRWRVHFNPPAAGTWQYKAEFVTGANVAAGGRGMPTAFSGTTGTLAIAPADPQAPGLLAKGPLRAVRARYPRFACGEFFLKAGAASPENLLAFADFDQTPPTHRYAPHVRDWRPGNPAWGDGRGKGLIGALNYLAGKGMNEVAFMTMNVRGEGRDVWPWTSEGERYRFDCSKLDQWETVFSHMERCGLVMHVVTQETGNDHLLDGGYLGLERKLYYRELVARFAHHNGIIWDLGQEATNSPEQLRSFARNLRDLDPYDHPIVAGAQPGQLDAVYTPLLGERAIDGASLEVVQPARVYAETLKWLARTERTGRPWFACADAVGGPRLGAPPDRQDAGHEALRKQGLWGNLMAGGGGVEWTFGRGTADNDLACESWRSRDRLWDLTRFAVDFFQQNLPFSRMAPHDELVGGGLHCLALPGQVYAIYLPQGGTAKLNLGRVNSEFAVRWFNPRTGETPRTGTVPLVRGPGRQSLGVMQEDPGNEWVVLVKRVN